jgi:Skp family chaperone for outer membrane proteins
MLIMNKILVFVGFMILAACGESVEEKENTKKITEDSIQLVTEKRLEVKYKLREELRDLESTKAQQETNLSRMRADLEVEYDRLNSVKQPKFLRPPHERENQIRNQVLRIEDTESRIAILQDKLIKTNSKISKIKQQLEPYE